MNLHLLTIPMCEQTFVNYCLWLTVLFIIIKCWYSKGDFCESICCQAFSYVYSCLSWVTLKLVIQKRIIKSVRKNGFFSFLGSVSQKGLKLLPCFKKPRNVPCIWTKKDILKIAEGCVRCKCSIILIWIIYQELIAMKLLFFKLLFDFTNLMNYYPQVDLMVKIYCFLP